MRARYYDPQLKRFLNRDVILGDLTDGQTLNRFAYVNGDPVGYVDPLGLFKWDGVETGEVNPLFRTGSNSERIPIDPAKFDRMKAQFERQGGVIMQGPEVTARLDKYQAEASNIGPDIIMHRENPTTSAVFEEFIHATQNRTGRATGDNWLQMEIEAQEKLIRYRKAYGIPNNETRQTIQALRNYRKLLSEE